MRPEKLSPGLLLAYEDYKREGDQALITHKRSLGIVFHNSTVKPTSSIVFIYCEPNADLSHLSRHGVQVNQETGSVRTAYLPIESLDIVSEDPAVLRIKPSRQLNQHLDVATKAVYVPEFRKKSNLTGKGVIIGIVDTGIDPKHPAFAGRILRIWDQTLSGSGVKEGSYGSELTKEHLTISNDTEGHGTHVAGITSGVDTTYCGIAQEAELVIVKSDLQDAHIADGVRYIFRVASEMKRPVVVNLSLGGHADAHDGSDSLSKIIDSETGSGRIVCCAAGNEGNHNIHGQTIVPPGKMGTMRFLVPTNNQVDMVLLNAWYPGNSQLEVSLRDTFGLVTPWQKIVTNGNPAQEYTLQSSKVQVVTPGPDPANGDHNFFLQIRSKGTLPVMGGVWQLRVRNTSSTQAHLDVWTIDNKTSVFFTGTSVTDSEKIGSPGAAKSAITVTSYTTKIKYTDIDNKQLEAGLHLNTISEFSSSGPLRNGARKPDLAAPGAMIVSTLSSGAHFDRSKIVNSKFVVLAGTSMATPFVTGLVALLLQRNPKLDPAGVKDLLRKNSSIPNHPIGTFDKKWGFGLINTLNL